MERKISEHLNVHHVRQNHASPLCTDYSRRRAGSGSTSQQPECQFGLRQPGARVHRPAEGARLAARAAGAGTAVGAGAAAGPGATAVAGATAGAVTLAASCCATSNKTSRLDASCDELGSEES